MHPFLLDKAYDFSKLEHFIDALYLVPIDILS